MTLGVPSAASRMLAGFRSRWTIPSRCASAIAAGQRLDQPSPPAAAARGCRRAARSRLPPADVLQLEEGQAVGLADVVDLDDVGVLELGDGLGLGQEAGGGDGVGVGAGQDHLQGAGAVQADLPGLVDDPHAAAAQLALDLVAGDGRRGAVGRGEVGLVGVRRVPDPGRGDGGVVREGHTPGGLARIDLTGESPPERVGGAIRPEVRHRRLGLGPPGSDRLSVPRFVDRP